MTRCADDYHVSLEEFGQNPVTKISDLAIGLAILDLAQLISSASVCVLPLDHHRSVLIEACPP